MARQCTYMVNKVTAQPLSMHPFAVIASFCSDSNWGRMHICCTPHIVKQSCWNAEVVLLAGLQAHRSWYHKCLNLLPCLPCRCSREHTCCTPFCKCSQEGHNAAPRERSCQPKGAAAKAAGRGCVASKTTGMPYSIIRECMFSSSKQTLMRACASVCHALTYKTSDYVDNSACKCVQLYQCCTTSHECQHHTCC